MILKCKTEKCIHDKTCYRKVADECEGQRYFSPKLNANRECGFYFNYKKY